MRACRIALLLGVVFFALLGALTTPPYVVMGVAPTFGVLVAGVAAAMGPAFPKTPSSRRTVVLSGLGAALLVPCLAGIGQFGASGAVVAILLMILGCVVAGGWIADCCDSSDPDAEAGMDVEQLQQVIRVLPTSMLLDEWRSTGDHVQTGADLDRRDRTILVRNLLLEELSRRDPVGVARWLSEGEEDGPEQYLRGDWDAAT